MRSCAYRTLTAAIALVSALAVSAGCSAIPGGYAHRAIATAAPGTTKTADSDGDGIGSFELCARGTYPSFAVLSLSASKKTKTLRPGSCVSEEFPKRGEHKVAIYGLDTSGPFLIGTDTFGGDYDERVKTTGTAEAPDWFAY